MAVKTGQVIPIAHIESSFGEKFGVPRQSMLAPVCEARIVFEPEYRNPDALRGLEGFSYIWLIWEFSLNGAHWNPTVRPPRLGGNRRMGVFATRSTFRPNPIGLSSVRIEKIYNDPELGPVIEVSGADLVNGTPIFDIKPYIPYADSHPEASAGWTDDISEKRLEVRWECEPGIITEKTRVGIEEILALDPRPSYIEAPERIYGVTFDGFNVRFRISGTTVAIISVQRLP